ncbi:MAG: rubrerythrin family protein [Chloroflexi bacterium HGW-Chloroflexi-10]|nr:MAG: rubrerythrin family protein [Chloroflexi bacterium HGW-Chloroflexi-10]
MTNIEQWVSFYLDERNGALLYQALVSVEKDGRLAEVYQRIADSEIRHAEVWAKKIQDAGHSVPKFSPTWRTRTMIWLSKRFGADLILPMIQNMEQMGSVGYAALGDMSRMQGEEQSHAFLVTQIKHSVRGGIQGGVLAQLEGRHRSAGGNALRAAVLGANDGLVSNMSLVMGVAGAAVGNRAILITGIAGMLAGAISMALGEWLSVQSSRELYSHQIKVETAEIEQAPEEEAEELALIYEARGLKPEQARLLADQILSDKDSAVQTLVREELGIDPEELGGSAWEAAITSFILFALGAVIPVAPFAFLSGMTAVLVSIALSVVGLFLLGAVITLFTGRGVWFSGMRMVVFGLLAAAVTFGIGHLIGVSLVG